jgi:hypothetical protein
MRPRKHDSGLPRNVYERRGRFNLVDAGRWFPLGDNRETALVRLATFIAPVEMARSDVLRAALVAWGRARLNAKGRRQLEFTLPRDDVLDLLEDCRWRCAVTRTPFSMDVCGPRNQRPFAPSLDRIDNARGYIPGNVRIVCVAANIAMNTWGEGVLLRMLDGRRNGRVLDTSN